MKKTRLNIGFLVFVAIICLATFTIEMINGRFWLTDFRVYYSAAMNFFSGAQVYGVCYDMGSGYYKYSPTVLFFFSPYCIFPYKIAAIIHFFILGFAFWYTFKLILDIFKKYLFINEFKHEGWLLSLAFICILIHFTREMHLGNINIIMLLLCLQVLHFYLERKSFAGSLMFGIVVLAKPFYLLLLIPLILRKSWKAIAWLGLIVAIGGLIPFIYLGFTDSMALYSGWFRTILSHNTDYPGMGSLDYLIRHNFFPSMPGFTEYLIIFTACVFASWFILSNIKMEKSQRNDKSLADMNFIIEWFLMISLLPVLFKTDWVQLLLSAPLIAFIISYITVRKKYWMIPGMVVLLFFYGANSDDLLGRELSGKILKLGLMGLSNFLLVMISLIMFLNFRKSKSREEL